jgi:hypothetical protein
MDYTLEDVKQFILEFTDLEYQFELGFYDSSITDNDWESLVEKLENCYGSRFGYYSTLNTTRNKSVMNDDYFSNKKRNLLKRKLFLIRKYENPVFGKGIVDTETNMVFSCFLGANIDIGMDDYVHNVSVGVVKGELKIITERGLNHEKGLDEIEWVYNKRSNVFTEDITIKEDGTLIDTLRIFQPEHPTTIADYNS